MVPAWSFQQFTSPSSADPGVVMSKPSSEVSLTPSTIASTALTPYSIAYMRLHLLGLPSEVRDEIWQTIFDDITVSISQCGWDRRPAIEYDGLSLTCHQIRDEIAFFWPRTIIQHNRIMTFTQPTISTIRDFKRLTLEIPHNENYYFFLAAAASLKRLVPVLRDLRIFFIGSDKFHIPLSLKTCGIHGANVKFITKRLAIDGQNHSIRQPLFVALRYLTNLHSLVVSNHNYPLLPKMVLEHKHQLKQLHLLADARTTVHRKHDLKAGGLKPFLIKPLQQGFPPVETLIIGANASLNSLHLAGACTLKLRHLTWIVPDLSLQSAGGIRVNWYQDTANLLYVLKNNSKKLQTLRMCFHEATYEADRAASTLIPAFRLNLEHLHIETLELHINSRSPWWGREVLQYLPNSLRRLYLSRELLDEHYLTLDIDSRYMACHSSSDGKTTSWFVEALQGISQDGYIQAGEDKRRSDFISFGGGQLGFVGYEYEPFTSTRFGDSKVRTARAEDTRTWLLTLNGRLLDRERNLHLAKYDGAKYIPPQRYRSTNQTCSSVEKNSIVGKHVPLWVYAPPSIKETESATRELKDSIVVNFAHPYFGNEEGAAEVFRNEPGVHQDNILERLWPDEVSMHSKEHWQTDCKAGARFEVEEEQPEGEFSVLKKAKNDSHSAWEEERLVHWVQNWTWYPRASSYVNEGEREAFLAERAGRSLESLACEATGDKELQG